MQTFGKILVMCGLVLAGVGALMMFSDKIPFIGKLPGDINIKKGNFQIYVPITTSIILSLLLSAIMWVVSHISKK